MSYGSGPELELPGAWRYSLFDGLAPAVGMLILLVAVLLFLGFLGAGMGFGAPFWILAVVLLGFYAKYFLRLASRLARAPGAVLRIFADRVEIVAPPDRTGTRSCFDVVVPIDTILTVHHERDRISIRTENGALVFFGSRLLVEDAFDLLDEKVALLERAADQRE